MRKFVIYALLPVGLLLPGCMNQEGAQQSENQSVDEYPIAYQTKQNDELREQANQMNSSKSDRNREEYLEGFQGDLKTPDENTRYQDELHEKDVEKITAAVNELEEVKLTQVTFLEDEVLVAVMLEQEDYRVEIDGIIQKIENRARKIVKDKKITVYTDAIYWNQMRDRDARDLNK